MPARPTGQAWNAFFPSKAILPMPAVTSPFGPSSATRTCIPSFSMDAGAFGARLGPRDAYRFARGEQMTASSGQPVKLSRPLDFLVVADHSDNMGFFPDLFAGKPEMLADPTGRKWYEMIQSGKGADAAIEIIVAFSQGTFPKDLMYFPGTRAYRGAWQETIAAAEHYNDPGRFTAFIGYEWTSNTGGNNLHRNVIFRDNGDRASQVEPFTTLSAAWERQPASSCGSGWKPMRRRPAAACWPSRTTAISAMARMFPDRRVVTASRWTASTPSSAPGGNGSMKPRRPRATARRIRSCRPMMSSRISSAGTSAISTAAFQDAEMLEFEYARSALKNGLKLRGELGTNPYKFGLIGSTDAHTGLGRGGGRKLLRQDHAPRTQPASDACDLRRQSEVRHQGDGLAGLLPPATLRSGPPKTPASRYGTPCSAAKPMPRPVRGMVVRFFGGWEFVSQDANNRLPAYIGYTKGVPMGGDLQARRRASRRHFWSPH